jgi:cytochrome c553
LKAVKLFFVITGLSVLAVNSMAKQMITYADAKTSGAVYVDLGEVGDSIGDQWVFDQPLVNHDKQVIGNNSGFCTRSKVANSSQCQWTLTINKSTIQVAGREFDKGSSAISIVGGTGEYVGIQGELISLKQEDGTFKQTLNYSMPQMTQVVNDLLNKVRKNGHYSCTECHGKTGNPVITDQYNKQSPILAGQKQHYLSKQLHDFKNGARSTREMENILQDYSDEELQIIATYYSDQTLQKSLNDPTIDTLKHSMEEDKAWIAKGRVIYNQGDSSKDIQACKTCHDKKGSDALAYYAPKLNGQHARYTRMVLKAYKGNTRTTDLNFSNVMQNISQQLNDDDIKYVSAYIQSLK